MAAKPIPFDKWVLPAGESHFQEQMTRFPRTVKGRLTYQYHKYEAALKLCKQRRTAVDVGSHVGLLAYWMARDFAKLVAFEPVSAHRACWRINLARLPRPDDRVLHACALGDHNGSIRIESEREKSGDARVAGIGGIPLYRLDDFALGLVDYVKIDAEGYELFILRGAEKTIRRDKPVIMVEQKPGHGANYGIGDTDAIPLLQSWGARLVVEISGDYIFVFD